MISIVDKLGPLLCTYTAAWPAQRDKLDPLLYTCTAAWPAQRNKMAHQVAQICMCMLQRGLQHVPISGWGVPCWGSRTFHGP